MMEPSILISSGPSSSSNASGAGAGTGVASPKKKLNKWPRVDSLDMDDGWESKNGGKGVERGTGRCEDIETNTPPMSGRKITEA